MSKCFDELWLKSEDEILEYIYEDIMVEEFESWGYYFNHNICAIEEIVSDGGYPDWRIDDNAPRALRRLYRSHKAEIVAKLNLYLLNECLLCLRAYYCEEVEGLDCRAVEDPDTGFTGYIEDIYNGEIYYYFYNPHLNRTQAFVLDEDSSDQIIDTDDLRGVYDEHITFADGEHFYYIYLRNERFRFCDPPPNGFNP